MPDRGFPAPPEGALGTGAGNRRALLLEAVLADPENRDARLVYADALVAANDPRGDFIQLDTALDGPLAIRKRDAMQTQRNALLAAHAKAWWPYPKVKLRVHQGFVVAASGYVSRLDAAAELFEREPIVEVEVRGLRGLEGAQALLAAPWLPRVRRLLVRGKLEDAGFAALVASPAIAQLETLNVTGNRITAAGLAALGTHLPGLRTLVLSRNKLEDAGAGALRSWRHLPTLEVLYLGRCGLTATGVATLIDGPPLRLAKLALTDNRLGNGVASAFAGKTTQLAALRHLDLVNTGIGAAGATQLCDSRLPALHKLDLRRNRLDPALATARPYLKL